MAAQSETCLDVHRHRLVGIVSDVPDSFASLAERLQSVGPRDEEAWTEFYRRFWPFVFAVTYRALRGDAEGARDVAQETFVRFLRRAPLAELTTEPRVKSYLFRMAENCAIDHLRARQRRSREVSGVDLDQFSDVSASIDRHTDILRLAEKNLQPIDRQILAMAIDGHSARDVARETGLSTSNVYVRMHRLRKRLQELLSSDSRKSDM